MKGIILAGGSGTRLYPSTLGTSKQLLSVYDKPMIYYPISVLMLSKIKDILIITTEFELPNYKRLLGTGENFGLNITYAIQTNPNGIAEAFIIGEEFIDNSQVCLILGDNLFYGQGLPDTLKKSMNFVKGASIFGYHVKNPEQYGVAGFDDRGNLDTIEEKPKIPRSKYAITGLYVYDNNVIEIAKELKPSDRGELEITDINLAYLKEGKLSISIFGRGISWMDMGTHKSILEASQFVQTIESRQGLKIACLEEIAYQNGWIQADFLLERAQIMKASSYGQYLSGLIG